MSKYDQGMTELQAQATAERRRRAVGKVLGIILLAIIAGMVLSALAGCATTPIAEKGSLEEIGDHATLRGLVRVAQMGEDCHSESEALRETIAGIFAGQGPRPNSVDVRPLSGSSYCGFAQGVADPIGTPDYGARNTAVTEVTVYWKYIVETDLKKAQSILDAMRPIPAAASKTAHAPQ